MARQMRMAVSRRMAAVAALGSALVGFTAARAAPPGSANAAISGNGVTDGSLLLRDFKRGQLERRFYTRADVDKAISKVSRTIKGDLAGYFKFDQAGFIKLDGAGYIKIDSAGIQKLSNAGFIKIDTADARYLKIDGAAQNTIKFDGRPASDFVQGHGQVLTRQAVVPAGVQGPDLLGLASFASVKPIGKEVEIKNLGTAPLTLAFGDGSVAPAPLAPGDAVTIAPRDVQLSASGGGAGGSTVVTLSLGSFADPGGLRWTAQALVGTG